MIGRSLLILLVAIGVFWVAALRLLPQSPAPAPRAVAVQHQPEAIAPNAQPAYNLLADIRLGSVAEMELLFDRVEQLLDRPLSEGERPLVSLVLHGEEVEFFALRNYEQYKDIVDRAAKLAALGAVDISICRTQMDNYGIQPNQVPAFLRQVPYGPDEVRRLREKGFVSM